MPPKSKQDFQLGDTVLCKHRDVPYEAKIVDIKNIDEADPSYIVHFVGWNSRYDEEVKFSAVKGKLGAATEKGLAEAAEQRNKLAAKGKKTKTQAAKVAGGDEKGSENGSRGNSPSQARKAAKRKAADIAAPVDVVPEKSVLDLNIAIPGNLRQVLIDDQNMITKQNYLAKLPARITIDQIVSEYIKSIGESETTLEEMDDLFIEYDGNATSTLSTTTIICCVKGIKDYFNVLVGYQLLYKTERHQYQDLVEADKVAKSKQNPKKKEKLSSEEEESLGYNASGVYGLPHLLRLISRMPSIFKLTSWNDHLINDVVASLHDFIVFLNKNHGNYFKESDDYVLAPNEYHKRNINAD